MGKLADIGGLDIADHLQPQRLEVVEEAGKLKAGATDLLDHDLDGLVIRRRVKHRKIELLNDLFHADTVGIHAESFPFPYSDLIIDEFLRLCNSLTADFVRFFASGDSALEKSRKN